MNCGKLHEQPHPQEENVQDQNGDSAVLLSVTLEVLNVPDNNIMCPFYNQINDVVLVKMCNIYLQIILTSSEMSSIPLKMMWYYIYIYIYIHF